MSFTLGNSEYTEPKDLTETLSSTEAQPEAAIDGTDRDLITLKIAEALQEKENGVYTAEPVAWNNPRSGNSGTITSIFQIDVEGMSGCADFITSANTVGGVRAYHGRTCPDGANNQKIVRLAPFSSGGQG
ncbi:MULTISPECIES: RT0821/Lpp0805 family surface protein [Pseudovibrio]|uniref:RT0821/Lpp0805 family surface protein n=1 Tax=Stappiaceae TaxID=2821832 RepID=UPI002366E3EC|nr:MULTISPECIES: RT0821/Lpp0805 family surface protein [Pseudovibrio]MDD7911183.1 RT0821/Lpp0805 family surface protein [Pseudovibrio exalbescens]MDX5593130.1 RT0821/Lpp0805 family surface protein [Pseudovibrio sp. SPO723]